MTLTTFLYGTHPPLYIFEVNEKILICSFCLSLTSTNLLQGKAYSWRVSVEFYPLTQSYTTEFSVLSFFFFETDLLSYNLLLSDTIHSFKRYNSMFLVYS